MLVRKVPVKTNGGADIVEDYEVTLIDWEVAGWYPTYWEYCMAAICFRWDDDWPCRVETVLKLYRIEFPWMHMLFNDLWF